MNPHYLNKAISCCSLLLLGLFSFSINLSAQLSVEWERTFGGTGWEELNAMTLSSDGGYVFAGLTTTDGPAPGTEVSQNTLDTVQWPDFNGDFWVTKTNGDGDLLWEKRYGGKQLDRLFDIRETADLGLIMGGESMSSTGAMRTDPTRGGLDYWIVKTDANGAKQWDKAFGGTGTDILRKILPLPDGGFLLGGYSNSNIGPTSDKKEDSRGGFDYWLIRLDASGNELWQKTLGGDSTDVLNHLEPTPDGNFLVAGWSSSGATFDKTGPFYGHNDIWLLKISSANGSILWQRTIGGAEEDVPNDITRSPDGTYVLSCHSGTGSHGHWDARIIKFADNLTSSTIIWDKHFGGQSSDIGYASAINSLGYILVAGLSVSEPADISGIGNKLAPLIGASDYWVLFLDPSGNLIWDQTLGGTQSEKAEFILNAHEYGYIIGGISASTVSPPYKSDPARGGNDFWVIRTGCSFPGPVLQDLPKTCSDDAITIDATIPDSCQACLYLWDDGTNGPIRQFAPDTAFMAKVTVVHPDGCELSDSLFIEIVPGPEGLAAGGEPITCYGRADGEFFIEAVDGGTPPYQFSLNGGNWEEVAHYANLPAGEYTLDILDANGCPFDTSFVLAQPEEVIVELGDDIFLDLGDSVQLQALTNLLPDSFSMVWGQPNHVSCLDCQEPWVQPYYSTTYSVTVKDLNGCSASDFVRVVVEKADAVFIPNVFSPNNDNINDFFTIYADRSVVKVNTLMVFDRWGEKMFEQHDFPPNVDQIGWNGKLNGKPMDPAVFVYWAEVEYIDGRKGFFEGGITLVK